MTFGDDFDLGTRRCVSMRCAFIPNMSLVTKLLDRQTGGRTDGRTDERTDGQGLNNMSPIFRCGGIKSKAFMEYVYLNFKWNLKDDSVSEFFISNISVHKRGQFMI